MVTKNYAQGSRRPAHILSAGPFRLKSQFLQPRFFWRALEATMWSRARSGVVDFLRYGRPAAGARDGVGGDDHRRAHGVPPAVDLRGHHLCHTRASRADSCPCAWSPLGAVAALRNVALARPSWSPLWSSPWSSLAPWALPEIAAELIQSLRRTWPRRPRRCSAFCASLAPRSLSSGIEGARIPRPRGCAARC
jgi:hypothetical protein